LMTPWRRLTSSSMIPILSSIRYRLTLFGWNAKENQAETRAR
jgi:hypothetical protein